MKIWIDLDNSPHVLFFAPIIRELHRRGVETVVTVRRCSQTQELAERHNLKFTVIGRHIEKSSLLVKASGTLLRSAALANFIRKHRVSAAVSHGSRSMVIAAGTLGIPVLTTYDYEFVSSSVFRAFSRVLLVPEVIREQMLAQGIPSTQLRSYPGLKEEVYVYDAKANTDIDYELGVEPGARLITVRPPATWAHYHTESSDRLFRTLLHKLADEPNVAVLILARSSGQEQELRRSFSLDTEKFRIRSQALDGLALLVRSYAVFSGGGTMSREAALLGRKTYSFFGGPLGAADKYLIDQGKLVMLHTEDDVLNLRLDLPDITRTDMRARGLAETITNEIQRFANGEQVLKVRSAATT
jgi:predicted glycosyltransferase